jgi:hypothetical protein
MAGNTRKYASYAHAWKRIAAGLKSGHYFEVVTLCESIIADRLLSFLLGVDPGCKLAVHDGLAKLVSKWRNSGTKLPHYKGEDLGVAVERWRKERNAVVHGLTKSMPGSPTLDLDLFLERAEAAASEGARLARAVSKWHKQELKRAQSMKSIERRA